MRTQNRTHAVMAQRHEDRDSLDDFPTPPWATRALFEHVLKVMPSPTNLICREPACGRGDMSRVLQSYFDAVVSSDTYDYGFGATGDYLATKCRVTDWMITNPPFNLAQRFVEKAFKETREGVAVLVRLQFIEGVGRYNGLYADNPPSIIAPFTERVPMFRGRLKKKGSTATAYAWFVWRHTPVKETKVVWIPPCRKLLERDGDYDKRQNDKPSRKRSIASMARGSSAR
jgi:hypothetical protein